MEGSKKFEDAALRGITRHHVWKSRTSDLTVINLRDPSELLTTQEPAPPLALAAAAAATVAAEVKRQAAPSSTPQQPRPTTGKQESLSALLSKLQLGRPATEAVTHPKAAHMATPAAAPAASSASPSAPSSQPLAPAVASLVMSSAAAAASPALSSLSAAPPVHVVETHHPTFPDLKESSSPAVGQFEFITGTNIPGQGVVKKTEGLNEVSSMALFHDPLWGGSSLLDGFGAAPPPVKRSPKPPSRTALSGLYVTAAATTGTTANISMNNTGTSTAHLFNTTPPAAVHTPVASPPVPTMAPQPMQMMGGLVSAPPLATSYPMYTMPLQYVAQPQFPGSVMYNSAAFFPYGATAMMMPQPQHVQQGYPVAPAAVMRPGTNIKAMPFVPGSTM
ncbi:hypothetical protein ABB37_03119 [Leptomonas pyrrhocoris]|uniref:Uncharacterized protein n=1 Tax=Leptomonas pyrrhocoris TaxID=157538 RepID=A0A0M9G6G3_LEPPY|nr:hypothetical protein ABB37_03119 [Leptomonas pyrrhocoris]XP_015661960.1 hypothetical protein ABB37_03119 [Leptomonas pyrrhocoris]KPA83520.1 hypothetical protein ABB37_03119 [Leptomonas pyrrhocoris]KPA83521.1 hypothetical protein ABB37_03119 [Leptomonas pyrrhocoris]|eukprot:XP_015661959.1 hypothetical protein ABB37_03119 [Leptomonas pyrrhocoris]